MASLYQFEFSLSQWRDDLRAAATTAAMGCRPEFPRNVQHAVLKCLGNEIDVFRP